MKGWCHIQIRIQSEGYCFFLIKFPPLTQRHQFPCQEAPLDWRCQRVTGNSGEEDHHSSGFMIGVKLLTPY